MQHASGARAAAFDEVLHRETLGEQGVHVFVEHRGVQRVALEGATHEKRPATPQQRAQHRHVEVDPGGNMRRGQAVAKQQIGQQQVVDMAAVARYINDLVALGDLLHALDLVDLDPVVDLVPEPAQQYFKKTDRGVGVVRGDFVGVAQRQGTGLVWRNIFAPGFIKDRLTHGRLVDQPFDQCASVRQIGANSRNFQVAKVHPQNALGHAHGAFVALVEVDQLAHMDRGRELHAGFAAQNQDPQQTPQASGHGPAIGKQQFPGAGLAVGRLAPEHADRDDLRIFARVLAQAVDQTGQYRRRPTLVLTAQPVGLGGQVKEGGGLDHLAHGNRQHRARQAGLGAFCVDHGQFGQRGRLQYIEHRAAAIQVQGQRRLIDGLRAHPQVQQATQGAKYKAAEWGGGHTASALVN